MDKWCCRLWTVGKICLRWIIPCRGRNIEIYQPDTGPASAGDIVLGLSVRPSVRQSVCPSRSLVTTISQVLLVQYDCNFAHVWPNNQGRRLFILRSKGQRSRSQDQVLWNPCDRNNSSFAGSIWFKLSMCVAQRQTKTPTDFEVKRSKVKVTGPCCVISLWPQ